MKKLSTRQKLIRNLLMTRLSFKRHKITPKVSHPRFLNKNPRTRLLNRLIRRIKKRRDERKGNDERPLKTRSLFARTPFKVTTG